MAMSDPGRDIKGRPSLKTQKYTGFVVENDDSKHPDGKKRQRVKVRVPQLHRSIPDEDLPWVMTQQGGGANAAAGNGGNGMGAVNVPAKNSKLFVSMESEDPHTLFYSGSPTTDDVNDDNELLDEDYPNTYGFVDQAGNKFATNTADNSITQTHVSGTTIHTASDGTVTIFSAADMHLAAKGSITIAADGNIKVHAKGSNDLKGSRINLNGAGAAASVKGIGKRSRPKLADRTNKPEA